MIKALDCLGLDVITINEGQKLASVKDVIYDQGSQKILAFLLDEGGIFVDPHIILTSDVKKIGQDALMIETAEDVQSAANVDETIRSIARDKIFLTKTKMVTTEGKSLGRVSDIYFDPLTGQVLEFELNQGIKNLASNKKRVKVGDIISIGQDATVVKAQVLEEVTDLENTTDLENPITELKSQTLTWLKISYHKLTHTASLVASTIKNFFTSITQTNQANTPTPNNSEYFAHEISKTSSKPPIKKSLEQFNQQVGGYLQAQKRIDDKRKQDAIGKHLTKTILSRNDEVLGKRGDMVTNKLIAAAEKEGLIDQVVKNTTEEPISEEP